MKTRCYFAHVAFGLDDHLLEKPSTTANLLIEVDAAAMVAGARKKHLKLSALNLRQKAHLARAIAKAAALDYLQTGNEFSKFPARRFIDFSLTDTPTYISICPPPAKILPDDCKVWRLAQDEADKLRTAPRSAKREKP